MSELKMCLQENEGTGALKEISNIEQGIMNIEGKKRNPSLHFIIRNSLFDIPYFSSDLHNVTLRCPMAQGPQEA